MAKATDFPVDELNDAKPDAIEAGQYTDFSKDPEPEGEKTIKVTLTLPAHIHAKIEAEADAEYRAVHNFLTFKLIKEYK